MKTLKVDSENYGVKYRGRTFGARPDLTHPELVAHELSEGEYIITEFDSFSLAFCEAHRLIANKDAHGNVQVIRITHHEPYQKTDSALFSEFLGEKETVTMTITGVTIIEGEPHFTSPKALSRYHPVNGWVIPEKIDIEEE